MSILGLDFETYGSVNLPDHGLDRYVSDKFFQPLIGSVAFEDSQGWHRETIDFIGNVSTGRRMLLDMIAPFTYVTAHNAPFEQAVLHWLDIELPPGRMIDSAVVARAVGAGSKLEAAAPQLLGINKMDLGSQLIKVFSILGPYQEENDNLAFDPRIIKDKPNEWDQFIHYCELDAELSARITMEWSRYLSKREVLYQDVTNAMNNAGWWVDRYSVEEMNRRFQENKLAAVDKFRTAVNAPDLNLNSLPQLKEWCRERGIRSSSFSEERVAKLLKKINEKLATMQPSDPKFAGYTEVKWLLETKQTLGGSSLSKLNKILDLVGNDGRLRDQYLHCGAGQTLRTTGKGVQMQNLKQIGDDPATMETLLDDDSVWDNEILARNIRQVFTATEENGFLIVGDFKSVESRGLGWLAGDMKKLDAFRTGLDMYKVQASLIYSISYDAVTKLQRQTGKVGELSCGYGAGPDAVVDFAAGMHVDLSHGEATKLVMDWREANPKVVTFWADIEDLMHCVLEGDYEQRLDLLDGFTLAIAKAVTPPSLLAMNPRAQTLHMVVFDPAGEVWLRRVFHGCHKSGRNVRYYKPSELKGGDLWRAGYTNPKTKQWQYYELYGGKLTGILTQSFCRELFFQSLTWIHKWCDKYDNVVPIGQFHDEIVLDWRPGNLAELPQLREAKSVLKVMMSDPGEAKSFPLEADIKHDYRYTK